MNIKIILNSKLSQNVEQVLEQVNDCVLKQNEGKLYYRS